jgi:hypothetical protein
VLTPCKSDENDNQRGDVINIGYHARGYLHIDAVIVPDLALLYVGTDLLSWLKDVLRAYHVHVTLCTSQTKSSQRFLLGQCVKNRIQKPVCLLI